MPVGAQAVYPFALFARRLQVAPNALYSHITSRPTLLEQLTDELLSRRGCSDAEAVDPPPEYMSR